MRWLAALGVVLGALFSARSVVAFDDELHIDVSPSLPTVSTIQIEGFPLLLSP